jgi:RNA polymerase sigma-70 factor, ECF subfamily
MNAEQRHQKPGRLPLPVTTILAMSSLLQSDLVRGSGRWGDACVTRAAASRAEALVDEKLVRRFNRGDESAFEEIVQRHRGRIYNVVNGCLHNWADAEEVVDDVFIRAYRGLGKFRGDSSLAVWLYRIAINLARNRYWYSFRRRRLAPSLDAPVSEAATPTVGDLVASEVPDPRQELDQQEFAAIVAECLERLAPCDRDILKLRGLLDDSYNRIAAELGINVGTVKSRIARARDHLRAAVTAIVPTTSMRSRQAS